MEVAVIGGGIIGCSIAYYLAKENIDVAIFEGQKIGGKSTSASPAWGRRSFGGD